MNKKRTAKAVLAAFGLSIALPAAAMAATDLEGHWAEAVMTKWEKKGMLSGYEDGTQRPEQPVTRAEFAALVNRVAGYKLAGNGVTFTDISADDWYASEVAIGVNAAYIGGYPDNTFRPNNSLTRAEAACMIARFTNLTSDASRAALFDDAAEHPDWAEGVIGAVANAGYMIGDENNCFNANKVMTRAETVAALDRIFFTYGSSGTVESSTVTVVTKPEDMTVPDGYSKEEISIYTIVYKYGIDDAHKEIKDAITYAYLPDRLEVSKVTLPAGSSFTTTIGDKTYDMLLKAPLVKTSVSNITVKEVKDVIDPDSEAWRALDTLKDDRVLIYCEQDSEGHLHWYIDGKTWEEQVEVFEQLEVTITEKQV